MIIKELRLRDFLVFPGEQSIQLPTEGESSVVVVLAPNNTGKTNIIRALKFLFYGHLPDCTEETAYRLIHDGTRASARVGAELHAWVQVSMELDGEEYVFRRTIRTAKRGKEQWMPPQLFLAKVNPISAQKVSLQIDSHGLFQTKLRTLVPEQLFDAFYFKGEPLDGKLLAGVQAIRESLASFLHEDRWEDIENAAEQVRQEYTREIARLTEKNQEYNKILNEEELVRSHLLREQKKLTDKQREAAELKTRFEDITIRLQALGTGGDSEKLFAQLRDLRGKIEVSKRNRERADNETARLVAASRGVPFLLSAVPTARRILSQLQEDNILPADVSERFVNRILSAKCCVCGRAHDEATREAWKRYKDKTLSVDLNRGLSDLLSAVQDTGSHSYARLAADVGAKLKLAGEARNKALTDTARLDAAITDIEKQLQGSPVEAIRELTQKLRELGTRREQVRGEIAHLENSINVAQRNLKTLKEKQQKARPSGALAAKEKELQRVRTRAEALRLLIQESREVLAQSFHDLLQQSVTEYYDGSAYDGSKASINRTTLLPAIETHGVVHGNLGGGQSQLLALAYIVSLSRLRKSLHAQMLRLGVGFGKVDDQSFFLDSPFNHVTEHYAHAIARFLEGNARQVVILLARQQWTLVRTIIEPVAAKVLAFEYHTMKETVAELKAKDPTLADFTYPLNGHSVKLIRELKDSEEAPYTKIIAFN